MNLLRKILNHTYALPVFLVLVAIWFGAWVFFVVIAPESLFGAPDEGLRYLVPKFIFEHGQLPTGYDAGTIHTMGNWSYAFYPQLLGSLVSAFFMYIVSLFNSMPDALVIAARMASVLFGVMMVLFVGKSVEKIFRENKDAKVLSFIAMSLVAAWPQVAFLSAYVNNDIVALCGVSIIIFACISGYKDQWNSKNTITLAAGFTVCLLGYINSYGFILFGALFFIVSLWWQADSKKYSIRLVGLVAAIVLVFAGPFFLRNAVIYNGDVLGMATFRQVTLEWETETGRQAQHSHSDLSGRGLKAFIEDDGFRQTQTDSAIARFGKMKIAPEEKYINVYRYFILIGSIGCVWLLAGVVIRTLRKDRGMKGLGNVVKSYKYGILLIGSIAAACMTTVALSLYYSLFIDYQPQGRYVLYLLIPLVIASVCGFNFLFKKLIIKRYRLPIILLLVAYYLFVSLVIFYKYVYIVNITQTL